MFCQMKERLFGSSKRTAMKQACGEVNSGRRVSGFAKNDDGMIAIMFALTVAVVVAMVGGAVDYGRWLSARSQTLQAMDSAVLAAGRVLQIGGKTEAEAIAAAKLVYAQNKSHLLDVDNVTFSVVDGKTVVATSASKVKTPFMSIAGVSKLPVNNISKAELAASSNAGSDIEISLMLDTTGSMRGNKMVDLKQAAIDLVDTVVWKDQSEFTSKIAVVPFAAYVNPGRYAYEIATNHSPRGNSDNRSCVKERSNSNRYTDAKPNKSNGYFDRYTDRSACQPQATILPLTNDKQSLKQRINEMQPIGSTAGHLGTQWAWYTLSPNFSDLWPVSSAPKSYSQLKELNEAGQPKLRKIAVLMTDGEYNLKYSGSNSATQARELCSNMKDKGITVYTVGFGIRKGGEADKTLKQCATSEEYYYNAADGDALKAAFRDIAFQIATLRLTN